MARDRRKSGRNPDRSKPPRAQLPVANFVVDLHRAVCRWDELVYELTTHLAPAVAEVPLSYAQSRSESSMLSLLLARALDIVAARLALEDLVADRSLRLSRMDDEQVASNVIEAVARDWEALLRMLSEQLYDMTVPRPSERFDRLMNRLRDELRQFLVVNLAPGAELHSCITSPLAPPEHRLAKARAMGRERPPATRDVRRDLASLALRLENADDADATKSKLIHFVRYDPWLSVAHGQAVANQLADAMLDADFTDDDDAAASARATEYENRAIEATDSFLYRSTCIRGLTPAELLLERSPDVSADHARRVRRWCDEAFFGVFVVEDVDIGVIRLLDLYDGQRYCATGKPSAIAQLVGRNLIIMSRIAPWDDAWMLSGAQRVIPVTPADIERTKQSMRTAGPTRTLRREDPLRDRIFDQAHQQHEAWLAFFDGKDEVVFDTGVALRDALTGLWRKRAIDLGGDPSRIPGPSIADQLLREQGVGAISHPESGISILAGYRELLAGLESTTAPSPQLVGLVSDYLFEESIEFWLIQRLAQRYPQRLQELIRLATRDQLFDIDRDLESLLRRYKGEQMRRFPQPGIKFVDPENVTR